VGLTDDKEFGIIKLEKSWDPGKADGRRHLLATFNNQKCQIERNRQSCKADQWQSSHVRLAMTHVTGANEVLRLQLRTSTAWRFKLFME
jgi:hypothetical protein